MSTASTSLAVSFRLLPSSSGMLACSAVRLAAPSHTRRGRSSVSERWVKVGGVVVGCSTRILSYGLAVRRCPDPARGYDLAVHLHLLPLLRD